MGGLLAVVEREGQGTTPGSGRAENILEYTSLTRAFWVRRREAEPMHLWLSV